MVMAFKIELNELKILTLMLFGLPLITATNIDCSGKAFHCVNSTHFMICVDLGSGVSKTLDDFVIPCPPTTGCRASNKYECEYLPVTTTVLPISPSDVTEHTSTLAWEPISVTTHEQNANEVEQSEKYNSLNNSTLKSEVELPTNVEPTDVESSLLPQDIAGVELDNQTIEVTKSNVEIFSTVASPVKTKEESSQNIVTESFGYTTEILGDTTASANSEIINSESYNGLSTTNDPDILYATTSSYLSTGTSFNLNEVEQAENNNSLNNSTITSEVELPTNVEPKEVESSVLSQDTIAGADLDTQNIDVTESNVEIFSTFASPVLTNEESSQNSVTVSFGYTTEILGDTTASANSEIIIPESYNGLSTTNDPDTLYVTPSSYLSTENTFNLNAVEQSKKYNSTLTSKVELPTNLEPTEVETSFLSQETIAGAGLDTQNIDVTNTHITNEESSKISVTESFGYNTEILGDTTASANSEIINSESYNGLSTTNDPDILYATTSSYLSTGTSFNLNEVEQAENNNSLNNSAITSEVELASNLEPTEVETSFLSQETIAGAGLDTQNIDVTNTHITNEESSQNSVTESFGYNTEILGDTTASANSEIINSESYNGLSTTNDPDILYATTSSYLSTGTSFNLNEVEQAENNNSLNNSTITSEVELPTNVEPIEVETSVLSQDTVAGADLDTQNIDVTKSNVEIFSTVASPVLTNEESAQNNVTESFGYTIKILGDTTASANSEIINSESYNGLSTSNDPDILYVTPSYLSTETSFNLNEEEYKKSTGAEVKATTTDENIIPKIDVVNTNISDTFDSVPSTTSLIITTGTEGTTSSSIVRYDTSFTLTPTMTNTQILGNIPLDTGLLTQSTGAVEPTFLVTENMSTVEKHPTAENIIVTETVTAEINNNTLNVPSNTIPIEITPQEEETTSSVIFKEITDETISSAKTLQTLTTITVDKGLPTPFYVSDETTMLPVATNTEMLNNILFTTATEAVSVPVLVTEEKIETSSDISFNDKLTNFATTVLTLEHEILTSSVAPILDKIPIDTFTTETPGLEVKESSINIEGNELTDTTVTESYKANSMIETIVSASSLGVEEIIDKQSTLFATSKENDTSLSMLPDTKNTADNIIIPESDLLTINNITNSIAETLASTLSIPEETTSSTVIIDADSSLTESPFVINTKTDSSVMNPGTKLPQYIFTEIKGDDTTEKTITTVSTNISGIEDTIKASGFVGDFNNENIENITNDLILETVTLTSTLSTEEISTDARTTILSKDKIRETSNKKVEAEGQTPGLDQIGIETSFDGISYDKTTEMVIDGLKLVPKKSITATDVGDLVTESHFMGVYNDNTTDTPNSILESKSPITKEKTNETGATSVKSENIASVIIPTEIPSTVVHTQVEKIHNDKMGEVTDITTNSPYVIESSTLSKSVSFTTTDAFLTIDLSPPVNSYINKDFVSSTPTLNNEYISNPISNVNLTPKSTTQTYFSSAEPNAGNIFTDDSIIRDIISDKDSPTTKAYTEQETKNNKPFENIAAVITSIDQIPVTESNVYTISDETLIFSEVNQQKLNIIKTKQTSAQETNINKGLNMQIETTNSDISSLASESITADKDSVLSTDPKKNITHLNDVSSPLVTGQINNNYIINNQLTNGVTELSNIGVSTQDIESVLNVPKKDVFLHYPAFKNTKIPSTTDSISISSENVKITNIEIDTTNKDNPLQELILNTSNFVKSSNESKENIRNSSVSPSNHRFPTGNGMSNTNKIVTTKNSMSDSFVNPLGISTDDKPTEAQNGGLKIAGNKNVDNSSIKMPQSGMTTPLRADSLTIAISNTYQTKNKPSQENQETLFIVVNTPKFVLEPNANEVIKSNKVDEAIPSTAIIEQQFIDATVNSKDVEAPANENSLSKTTTVRKSADSHFKIEMNRKVGSVSVISASVESVSTTPRDKTSDFESTSISDLPKNKIDKTRPTQMKKVTAESVAEAVLTSTSFTNIDTSLSTLAPKVPKPVTQNIYSKTDSKSVISASGKSFSTTPTDKTNDLERSSKFDSPNNKTDKLLQTQIKQVTAESVTEAVLPSTSFATLNILAPKINQKTTEVPSVTPTTADKRKSPFNCIGRRRGRYSASDDCRKYYVCIGLIHPIVGVCPGNTVFSNVNKQCTKNLSHCIIGNEFQCFSEGRFFDIYKNNIYYICVKNNAGKFYRFKLQCQIGFLLNKSSMKCIKDKPVSISESIDSTSKSESDKSSNNKSKEENEKEDFECEEEGKFVYPGNCRKYYECKKKKSAFRRRTRKCDSDEIFHQEKRKCVDADSYEC